MDSFKLLNTKRNKLCLLVNSYKFIKKKELQNGEIQWICSKNTCSVSLKSDQKITLILEKNKSKHDHSGLSDKQIKKLEFSIIAKRRALEKINDRPNTIIRTIAQDSKLIDMKDINNIKQQIYRKRRLVLSKFPTSQKETLIHIYNAQESFRTSKGEKFIFVPETKTFVTFTCKTNLEILCCENIQLMGDGTFNYSPMFFKQCYTISTYINGLFIPLVFIFLINKNQEAYSNMWYYIQKICKDFGLNFCPKTIKLDFEHNNHISIRSIFPNCTILGCRFYLTKTWYHKLNIEMVELLNHCKDKTSDIGNWLRLFFGLAFLPSNEIPDAFSKLIQAAPNTNKILMQFPDYLLKYYIEEELGNVLFPPIIWSRTPINDFNTTNKIELFHRHMNGLLNYPYKTIWNLIEEIHKIQNENYSKISNMKLNNFPILSNDEKRILQFNNDIWCEYSTGNITLFDYLKTMGQIYNYIFS